MTPEIPPGFSGVVSISRAAEVEFEQAYGLADRAHEIPATVTTQFAMGSATKGFTAVAVLGLIADGLLTLDSAVRPILGDDLPLIGDDVTVELLLAHRSGIGDYVDEDLDEEEPLKVAVQALDSTEAYLPALDGFPAKFRAGTRFSYCNSGYAVLALVAERVSGTSFGALLNARVWQPAAMTDTAFLRSDQLPGNAAIGYLDDGRTNVFALPLVGTGDGGAYTTVADMRSFWTALFEGRIVPLEWVSTMVSPVSVDTGNPYRYGMGCWLAPSGPAVFLEGADHGVSLRSWHDPSTARTATIVSNTSDGAWPIAREIGAQLFGIRSTTAG